MTIYKAQDIQIGADVVTSAKVAIKGVMSDDMRPQAMTKPHPNPRFSVSRAKGVNLSIRLATVISDQGDSSHA